MNDTKVNKNLEKKKAAVAEISDKVNRAKAMVFTNYQGMTHHQIETLKKALRGVDAELAVTKNTLLKRALADANIKAEKEDSFKNPTATIFAYSDPVSPIKELAKIIKLLKLPAIKFGIVEGHVVSEADVVRLSILPSRETLLAQLVGGMKSPIYGLHRTLSWNLQKFVMTLQAISDKKKATS